MVRILTTEGPTISTKSVKSGKVREAALDCAQAGCNGSRTGTLQSTAVRLKAPIHKPMRLSLKLLNIMFNSKTSEGWLYLKKPASVIRYQHHLSKIGAISRF
jgi:hypothetical protein